MLVLSRRIEEAIKIGDDVEIKILSLTPTSVRIGITAPKNISIYRKEIYDIIQKQNLLASKAEKKNIGELGKMLEEQNVGKKDKDS